jgi:hypothetical protein
MHSRRSPSLFLSACLLHCQYIPCNPLTFSPRPDRGSRISTQEKGPFGRSTRRRTPSRSKTGTPSRKEDRDQAENWRVIDDIFTRAKEKEQTQDPQRPSTPSGGILAITSGADSAGQTAQSTPSGTPTEVMLHGFPPAFQYAAIEFYERVSQGAILEDYDRYPPSTKYDLTLSLRRSRGTGKLSREALLKRNRYHGGDHWIKVTFDSAEAAERATYASPHIIKGYVVYAEAYRGVGPAADEAYLATPAAQEAIASATVSPSQRSSATLQQQNISAASDTASSATATASGTLLDPFASSNGPSRSALTPQSQARANGALTSPPTLSANVSSSTAVQSSPERPLRIRGAKRAVLLPAEQALLPATSRWQRVFGSWPLIGLLLGGGSDLIGDAVPRDATNNFDAVNASMYWLFWWWIDWIFGSDFCGLKGED